MSDCGHGLHQKCKIQGVGFVCIGCDPSWHQVDTSGPLSLFVRTEPVTAPVEPVIDGLTIVHASWEIA